MSFADRIYATVLGACSLPELEQDCVCLVCHGSTAPPLASFRCRCTMDGSAPCRKQAHLKCVLEGTRWSSNVGRMSMADKTLVYDCPDHHEEPLFCVCNMPTNDEVMFNCEECVNWYHQGCLISDSSMYDENVAWVCARCKSIIAHNDPEEMLELQERKSEYNVKNARAFEIQEAQDALLDIRFMADNHASTIDSILMSDHLQLQGKVQLFQIRAAIDSLTLGITKCDPNVNSICQKETIALIAETRQKLDKVLASYSVVAATALDLAKDANRLFSNPSSEPFDGRLVSRLQPLLQRGEKISREFEDFRCSSEDDIAFLCYLDALRWMASFCDAMRAIKNREDSASKAQAIDDALSGSSFVQRRFAELEPRSGGRNKGPVVASPTVAVYRGAIAGINWVTKQAKRSIKGRGDLLSLGAYEAHPALLAVRGDKKPKTSQHGLNLIMHKTTDGDSDGRAKFAGLLLQPHGGRQLTDAEIRLLALFEAKEALLKQREEEKLAAARSIAKGRDYTEKQLPVQLPKPAAPVPAPASASATASATATAAAAKKRPPEKSKAAAEPERNAPTQEAPLPLRVAASTEGAVPAPASTSASASASAVMSTAEDDVNKIFDVPEAIKIRKKQRMDDDAAAMEIVESDPLVDGSEIFRRTGMGSLLLDVPWDPRTAKESAVFPLHNFGIIYDEDDALLTKENQTVVLLIKMPEGAKQWAVNICPANHLNNYNVLLHFNPRYAAGKTADRKEVVLNDREGTWGTVLKDRIRTEGRTRSLLASTIELAIQIRKEGFVIFANQQCLCMFPHRRPLSTGQQMVLSLPTCDDMATPLDGIVTKIWWGRVPNSAYHVPADVYNSEAAQKWAEAATVLLQRPVRARALIVKGLPLQSSPQELHVIEEGLKNVFGVREIEPEAINVVPGKGVAYIRLETAQQQRDVLDNLKGYKIADQENKKYAIKFEPWV